RHFWTRFAPAFAECGGAAHPPPTPRGGRRPRRRGARSRRAPRARRAPTLRSRRRPARHLAARPPDSPARGPGRGAPPSLRGAGAALRSIWAANLPVRGALDDKLRWFYLDGPHGAGRAFLLHDGPGAGAPIGAAGLGVRALWLRDRPLRAALFADLAIAPA